MPRTGLLRISLSIFLIAAGIVSGSTGPALAQSSLANGRGNPAIQLRNAGRVRTISIAAIASNAASASSCHARHAMRGLVPGQYMAKQNRRVGNIWKAGSVEAGSAIPKV